MTTFPVLKFEPLFKSVIWGGKRIAEFKGIPSQGDTIGESWELSCVPGNESVVVEGEFKGRNLKELLLEFPTELMGEKLLARYGKGEFPLLIKLIDSADDLSVQVHPDDSLPVSVTIVWARSRCGLAWLRLTMHIFMPD